MGYFRSPHHSSEQPTKVNVLSADWTAGYRRGRESAMQDHSLGYNSRLIDAMPTLQELVALNGLLVNRLCELCGGKTPKTVGEVTLEQDKIKELQDLQKKIDTLHAIRCGR